MNKTLSANQPRPERVADAVTEDGINWTAVEGVRVKDIRAAIALKVGFNWKRPYEGVFHRGHWRSIHAYLKGEWPDRTGPYKREIVESTLRGLPGQVDHYGGDREEIEPLLIEDTDGNVREPTRKRSLARLLYAIEVVGDQRPFMHTTTTAGP